ncbi:MAG: hypothetical protein QOG55_2095 [Acidobacteriaceae bacterium]|jgi:hypothetical protein|nr:hypothetical protein [Acidobacteriaceae bacterium]
MVAASAVDGLVTANAGLAVPATVIICGELAASSAIEMVSVPLPLASGAKLTAMEQLAFDAIAAAQGLAGLINSETFAPLYATLEICRGALPELVTVTVVGLLMVPCVAATDTEEGVMVTVGAVDVVAVPVPLSATLCGLPEALSEICSIP